jgi:hypothetical protein
MTQAQMTVAVIAARFGTGGAFSPLTAGTFAVIAAQSRAVEPADPSRATRTTAAMKPRLGLSSPRKSFYTANHRRLSRDYPAHRWKYVIIHTNLGATLGPAAYTD